MILTPSGELFSNIRGQAGQTDGERDMRFAWVDGSQKERGKRFLKGPSGSRSSRGWRHSVPLGGRFKGLLVLVGGTCYANTAVVDIRIFSLQISRLNPFGGRRYDRACAG
jgi:hypothetical protein